MIFNLKIEDAFLLDLPIIDVRSPGEFQKGHISSAINIPLFSNEERADVGTIYKQISKEKAIEKGYEYVIPKLESFVLNTLKSAPNKKVIVHCWRGGMRSQSFAKHLNENGFKEVYVVQGGYKSFRNLVLNNFAKPIELNVLGGYTGSGKTQILKELKKIGKQVIDLEGLANHRGSAFGGIGQKEQPSVEQFENNLFFELKHFNLQKPVWIEDESHCIGKINVPKQFFEQLRNAKLYFIDIPKEVRAKYLVQDYACFKKELLKDSILRISKRLGGLNTKKAITALEKENYFEVALISLYYYDKLYLKGMEKRKSESVLKIKLPSTNSYINALKIESLTNKYEQSKIN